MTVCSVESCGGKLIARGLCSLHYQRAKSSGELPPRRFLKAEGNCKAEGCLQAADSLGFCQKHYHRLRRHGSADVRLRVANGEGARPCTIDGCTGQGSRRGLCVLHYQRSRAKPRKRPIIATCTVDGCSKRHEALGLCAMHRMRLKKVGDVGPVGLKISERGAQLQWLHDHREYDGQECLIWPFPRNADGYGQVTMNGKHRSAQSAMCEIAHGPAKLSKPDAAHSCGNGRLGCLHPKHLRWATRQQNCADTVAHGTTTRGERNHHAKLTEAQVLSILADAREDQVIADSLGVTSKTVRRIKQGRSWSYLRSAA